MQYRKVRNAIYVTFVLGNKVHVKYDFQFDTVHFYEIEAHWKSATLDQFSFGVFLQITVLNNLLNYFDFLN